METSLSLNYYSNVFLIFPVHKISAEQSDISSVLADIARNVLDFLIKTNTIEIKRDNQDPQSIINEVGFHFFFNLSH